MISKNLLLFLAFAGCSLAFPPNKGPYVVTWTGDDELAQQEHGLLGGKMCTRGPAYWCHNITHAAECHAMQHCITKVWENPKEKLPEDNDSVCEVCLDMVKQARDQLLSNETQEELRQVLEGSCNLIPLKIVSKECDKLADDFIPELIDALTSRMDPQMVCHISGLCNSARIDQMLAEMKELDGPKQIEPLDPYNIDTCPKCKHYVGEAVKTLKRLTKKDLRIKLLGVCGYLGSYSESCRQAVIHEMDAIYQYIQNNMKPVELCGLVGLCTESTLHRVPLNGGHYQEVTSVRVWQPPTEHGDDLECDFCKQLTVSVHRWLVANATEDEFVQVIQNLCKQTGKYKQECLSLAEQYGKQVYQILAEGLNPDELCQSIGVCPSSSVGFTRVQLERDNAPIWTMIAIGDKAKKDIPESSSEETEDDEDDIIPLMKLRPAERLTGDDEIQSISMKQLISPERLAGDDEIQSIPMKQLISPERLAGDDEINSMSKEKCEFCQYVLRYLQKYLNNMDTEAEIRDKVDRLCTEYLPTEVADQCKLFVEEYGDDLVNLIAQEVDPDEMCPRLGLCNATTTTRAPVTSVGQPVKDILPTCALCTFTIEKLIALVGKNLSKESIDHAMESVCSIVPRNEEKKCMDFMKGYGDEVANMIVIYGTSHGVCAALHLCIMAPAPTSQKILVDAQLPLDRYLPYAVALDRVSQLEAVDAKDDSKKCVICEFVITTLDQRLQDNATEEQIKTEVEQICTHLPKTVKGKCLTLVELYGEEIIQYLSQEVDPEEICERLKLCLSEKSLEAIRKLKMDRCQLCMLVSDYLGTMIAHEKADINIDDLAQQVCAVIPKSFRQECRAMIEDYGSYLLDTLSKETDNGRACAQIQLCPKSYLTDIDNTVEVFEY